MRKARCGSSVGRADGSVSATGTFVWNVRTVLVGFFFWVKVL